MSFTQYGDYFYLYISFLVLIPVIIMGLFNKKTKYYGLILSAVMAFLIMGRGWGLLLFIAFILGETFVIYTYLYIRKKTDNKYIYYLFLFFSMLPVIITKCAGLTRYASTIGFIGLSYLNFRAIQMVIEIYDGKIKDVNFFTYL